MKTAVEFFEGVLRNLAFDEKHHLELGDIRITQGMIDHITRQSKAMEKQQIKQAYIAGYQSAKESKDYKESEQYYNETYGEQ